MISVFRAYWPSIRKYQWLFLGTTVLMILGVTLKAAPPFLLRRILDLFQAGDIEGALEGSVVCIAIVFLAMHLVWIFYDWGIIELETRVMKDADNRCFASILSQSMAFFENAFAGSLVKCATRFRHSFEVIADAYFFQLGRSSVMILITFVVFLLEKPALALVFGAWSIAFIAFNVHAGRVRYRLAREESDADSACGGAFADAFGNAETIKACGRDREERERFATYVDTCFRTRRKAWTTTIKIMRLQGILMSLLEVTIIWWLVRGWRQGTVTAGDFIFFQTYVILLITQLWDFGSQLHRLNQSVAEASEMAEILSKIPEVQDAPGAIRLNIEEPSVELHSVTFGYGNGLNVIDNFSLSIRAGEHVALVGKSGSGKTTLSRLLLRLYDLRGGYIRIDRQDIANVTQASLRQQVAFVSQHVNLFGRTIRENIRLTRPDASDEEIIAAAKRAHAWEFIEKFKDGLGTMVGERGIKLSGGQRQRIALARAFLADAPVVILDEATSALDSVTEAHIQAAMTDLMQGRTCIVIAHRLSTIMQSNRIIVLSDGRIVEQGTHQKLLRNSGEYASLWHHQSGGYLVC